MEPKRVAVVVVLMEQPASGEVVLEFVEPTSGTVSGINLTALDGSLFHHLGLLAWARQELLLGHSFKDYERKG